MSFFDRFPSDELVGVLIFEQSAKSDKHTILSWIYPSIDDDTRNVITSRLSFADAGYSQYNKHWHYGFPYNTSLPSAVLPHTQAFCVVVLSKFNIPERYLTLAKTLADVYAASGSPPKVLQAWFSAFNSGQIPKSNITGRDSDSATIAWDIKASDPSKLIKAAGISTLVRLLGVEAILLWHAMITQRRIAVCGDRVSDVVKIVRTLPQLASHRSSVLTDKTGVTTGTEAVLSADLGVTIFPIVALNNPQSPIDVDTHTRVQLGIEAQVKALKGGDDGVPAGLSHYVAGFTDASIASRQDLWDVCVDLTGSTIAVAEHAKDDFIMTSTHKDVAKALLAVAEEDTVTDAQMTAVLREKTEGIVARIRSWFPAGIPQDNGHTQFQERCKSEGINAALEKFLWTVATTEKLHATT